MGRVWDGQKQGPGDRPLFCKRVCAAAARATGRFSDSAVAFLSVLS